MRVPNIIQRSDTTLLFTNFVSKMLEFLMGQFVTCFWEQGLLLKNYDWFFVHALKNSKMVTYQTSNFCWFSGTNEIGTKSRNKPSKIWKIPFLECFTLSNTKKRWKLKLRKCKHSESRFCWFVLKFCKKFSVSFKNINKQTN